MLILSIFLQISENTVWSYCVAIFFYVMQDFILHSLGYANSNTTMKEEI